MRDLIVKIATKLGFYKLLVKIDTYFIDLRKNWYFKKYGTQTLIDFDNACRKAGVQMIPFFGTQLGLFRDKGFIPYDNDIDVAVIASQRPDNFVKILEDAGFRLELVFYFKESGLEVTEHYVRNHVQVDIFNLYDYSEQDYCCYVAYRHETKDWKEANQTDGFPFGLWPFVKSGLTEQEYFGHRFYMPDKTEEWLKGVYGEDFMTPVKGWTIGKRKTRRILPKERIYRKYLQ